MTLLGVFIAIIGIAGFLVNFIGVVKWTGLMGSFTVWGGIAIAGVVLAILTRRPGD